MIIHVTSVELETVEALTIIVIGGDEWTVDEKGDIGSRKVYSFVLYSIVEAY